MLIVSKMIPRHYTCRKEAAIFEFFLTTDKQLLLKGFCEHCKTEVVLIVPLQEMMDNCPIEADSKLTIKDVSDLHQMGISLPDSPNPP